MDKISPTFALKANKFLESGKSEDAIALCQAGLLLYPDYATGYAVLVRAHRMRHDDFAAYTVLADALERLPLEKSLLRLREEMTTPTHIPETTEETEETSEEALVVEKPVIEESVIEEPIVEEPIEEMPETVPPVAQSPLTAQPESEISDREYSVAGQEEQKDTFDNLIAVGQILWTEEPNEHEESHKQTVQQVMPDEIAQDNAEQEVPVEEQTIGEGFVTDFPPQDAAVLISNESRVGESSADAEKEEQSIPLEQSLSSARTERPAVHLRIIETITTPESTSFFCRSRNIRLIPGLEFTSLRFEGQSPVYRQGYRIPEPPPFPDVARFKPLIKAPLRIHSFAAGEERGKLTPLEELARRLEAARIPRIEEEEQATPHKSAVSASPQSSVITETIARIYEMQGAVDEAIHAYETLIREKPEKAEEFRQKIVELQNKG